MPLVNMTEQLPQQLLLFTEYIKFFLQLRDRGQYFKLTSAFSKLSFLDVLIT